MTDTLDDNLIPSSKGQYILYRSFLNLDDAKEIEALLTQHNIPHQLDIPRESLDASIIGKGIDTKATLKILATEKTKVDAILAQKTQEISLDALQNHPLQAYTNEDLYEMLLKPDEWPIENITLAKMILAQRGHNITEEEILQLRTDRLAEIRKGRKGSLLVIVIMLAVLLLDFLSTCAFIFLDFGAMKIFYFSLVALLVGAYYVYTKSHDINGEAYFEYDKETRSVGRFMLIGSVVLFLGKLLYLYSWG